MLSQRIEQMTGDYQAELAKWLEHKNATLGQADETSMYRWDTDQSLIYFLTRPNKGKAITDNNPYVNLVDIEEFDVASELYPYFDVPKTWTKDLYVKYFSPMHKEVVGKADEFLTQIMLDKERMTAEAQGKRTPPVAAKQEEDLHNLKEEIRAYAVGLGFPAMGVTKLAAKISAPHCDAGGRTARHLCLRLAAERTRPRSCGRRGLCVHRCLLRRALLPGRLPPLPEPTSAARSQDRQRPRPFPEPGYRRYR